MSDFCFCCTQPATHKEGIFPLCDECKGAAFHRVEDLVGPIGWKGRTGKAKAYDFICPAHGKIEPVDVNNVREVGWRKLESGDLSWVLSYDEKPPQLEMF